MNTLANFGATKHTTNLLEKFLRSMTATVSLTPPAVNLYALEKAMCCCVLMMVKYFQGVASSSAYCVQKSGCFPRHKQM